MYRNAARYLRDRGVDIAFASDAVSVVFKRLLQSGVPTAREWEAYLVRAAINAAKDEVKKASRRPDKPLPTGDVSVVFAAEAEEVEMEDEVIAAIDAERMLKRVLAALDELPEPRRRAVRGRVLEGKTNVQLASELAVTPPYISQLYEAGVRDLTALLGAPDPSLAGGGS